METRRYRLSELLSIKNGKDYKHLNEGEIPVFGSGGYMLSVDSYLYDKVSILLPRKGTLSNIQYYNQGKFWTVDTCFYSKINESLVVPYYLYRYLRGLDLSGFDTGASIPSMTQKTYNSIKVDLPSLPTQQKIASILSAYDSQIENNQKRIKLLEQMAENLYKEWFVRFRFPGYETAEFKSSSLGNIPDTFTVENMGNVLDYYIGGGWGQDAQSEEYPQDAYVIRGADFPRVQSGDVTSCPYRYHKTSNYKARQLKPLDVILEVSGGTQEQPVGRTVIVTENLLNRLDNKVICASFCKQLRLDKSKVLPFYYYYWMKFVYDTRMIDKFQLQSTGIINFKFEYFLRKGLISIPPMSLMKQFSDIIEPLFAEKDLLSEQINHLTRQRDLLLPRLMSGKLEVKGE